MSTDPMTALQDQLGILGTALAQWDQRETAAGEAAVRRAASTAVNAIDAMLRDLYLIRGRLVSEIRAADDATAARTDALLARRRDGGQL
jgi:hypothetical protein